MSRGPNTKSGRNDAPGTAAHAPRPRSKRRWLRVGLIGALCCIGLLGIALWIFTRSWFIIAQIQPELAAKLGGDLSIGSARYEGGGRFQFRDITLRAPGHRGPAGDVLFVERASVEVNAAALLRGDVHLEAIDLAGVVLRLSEDESDPGVFTFMTLDPQWETEETEHITSLPRLAVPYVTVEYGTHGPGGYTVRGKRWLAGAMKAEEDERTYAFHLLEVDEGGSHLREGIAVNGKWNVATNEHEAHVGGLVLDAAAYNMMPQAARMWWDRMDLEGRVSDAQIHWSEGEPLSIVFDIENVGLTLPITTEDLWARYHGGQVIGHSPRPRMSVSSGTIRFVGDAIVLDLVGELRSEAEPDGAAHVPWRVTLNLRDLPPVDWDDRDAWMDTVLESAPFEMTFEMRDFGVTPDAAGELPPVDLPLRVAQVLERFLLRDWSLSAQVVVERAAPHRDEAGDLAPQPILHRGEVTIRQASGAYEEFPYRLTNVDAELDFDNEGVRIRSLRGLAPNGALVELAGEIAPPGRFPMVALTVRAHGVPVDEQLREALRSRNLAFFDWLMNLPAEHALRESGKLGDAGPDERGEEAPDRTPFQLGGTVNLDLRIDRALGPGEDTIVSGTIGINQVGVLYEHFPYPFTVTGGSLRLEHEGVRIIEDEGGNGLPIATAGGGTGFISGGMGREATKDGWRAVPDFTIRVENDSLNDLIYAAIPLTRHEREAAAESLWPGGAYSEAALLLQRAGLDGTLDYVGIITQEGDGIGYSFDVEFAGRARPGRELAGWLAEAGLIWPGDLDVEDVQARINVADKGMELIDFNGSHEHGLLRAEGRVDWSGPERHTALDLHLEDLVLGRYLIDLMPHEQVEMVGQLWERYQPSGVFNATLEFRSAGDQVEQPRLLIDPSRAQVVIEDERMTLRRHSGRLFVQGGQVRCEEFVLGFMRGENGDEPIDDGRMRLDGSYGLSPDADELVVQGVWLDGRLDSPIIIEAMRLIGATSHIDDFQRLKPSGEFDAHFHYASGGQYGLIASPRSVQFELGETLLEAALNEDSRVHFSEGLVRLETVSGALGSSSFAMAGLVHTGPAILLDLDHLTFDGALMDEQTQALLPREVRNLLAQIEFADGERTALERGILSLMQREPGSSRWLTSFRGTLRTEGASFTTGVGVTDFHGTLDLAVDDNADGPPRVALDVSGERLLVLDRLMTDLRAPDIGLSEDGRTLVIPEIRAVCYNGVFWAQASVGLNDGEPYEARIELVGGSVQRLVTGEADRSRRRASEREGRAYGGVRLSGVVGDSESRVGRGMIRAVGSHLEHVPFILQIMNLLQLTLPVRGEVNHAHAEFFIEGEQATFERILMESTFGDIATLQLHGEGWMNLRTLDIHTQFRSRSAMILIRDLVGGVGDQLFAIEITGTLRNPRARLVPLPGLAAPAARSAARAAAVIGSAGESDAE